MGVLAVRALFFGVYFKVPDFWKLPSGLRSTVTTTLLAIPCLSSPGPPSGAMLCPGPQVPKYKVCRLSKADMVIMASGRYLLFGYLDPGTISGL